MPDVREVQGAQLGVRGVDHAVILARSDGVYDPVKGALDHD